MATILRYSRPDLALTLAPGDSGALAAKAERSLASLKNGQQGGAVEAAAKQALVAQAVNPQALRIAGLARELKQDRAGANSRITLASRLSRRELGTQLWLIERGAEQNNLAQTLRHYDSALRTNAAISQMLYPILAQALPDASIRTALVPYVKADPPWIRDFLIHSVYNEVNLTSVSELLLQAGGLGDRGRYKDLKQALLDALVKKGDFREAQRFAAFARPESRPASVSTAFVPKTIDPNANPFAWRTFDSAEVSSGFVPSSDEGRLHLQAWVENSSRQLAASKLLVLGPGRYQIEAKAVKASAADGDALWELYCFVGPQKNLKFRYSLMPAAGTTQTALFEIGRDCAYQSLDLILVGGASSQGTSFTAGEVGLRRE